VGLTAHGPRATPIAGDELRGDHGPMFRNPVIVCLTLAAIVVVATLAEAVVVLTSRRRRRIAW
jgi:hypothetical protein